MATLNGRVSKLEAVTAMTGGPAICSMCERRHARPPLPLMTVEAIVREALVPRGGIAPRLCLCPCCEPARAIALLSHGLPVSEDAARGAERKPQPGVARLR